MLYVSAATDRDREAMARVKEKAPSWSGTAVFDGDFIELSSEEYRGS